MTLHDITQGLAVMVYQWYYAIPTSRRGKQHILRVPSLMLDRDRIEVPAWRRGSYDEEEYRDRMSNRPYIPASIWYPEVERICRTRQRAYRWDHNRYPPRSDQNGVCSDCFEWTRLNFELAPSRAFNGSGTYHRGPGLYRERPYRETLEQRYYERN